MNTACSSSLVAVHLACQSLQQEESDLAIAAGVNLLLLPDLSIAFSKAGMLSSDGQCKTFDAAANGYVRSEGCGVLILKKLSHAIKDHNPIFAVIRSTAVNQDGASNGLTAPSEASQELLLLKALASAKLPPERISYIETHGTGTALGDVVEMNALEQVYSNRKQDNLLFLGSVKTNIGHAEGAAGMAGLIKTILALQHKEIPPHIHFKQLNPQIKITPEITIPTQLIKWKPYQDHTLCAGVSSFGFSGTNSHVILEEAPPHKQSPTHLPAYLITFSAKTENALQNKIRDLDEWLEKQSKEISLYDLSWTLNTGRSHFEKRSVLIIHSFDELHNILKQMQSNIDKKPKSVFYSSVDAKTEMDISMMEKAFEQLINIDFPLSNKEYYDQLVILAKFYINGSEIDFKKLYPINGNIISLPTYPFAKDSYWVPEMTQIAKEEINDMNLFEKVQFQVVKIISSVLKKRETDIQLDENLSKLGFDSIDFNFLSDELEKFYNIQFTTDKLFEHKTLRTLIDYLVKEYRSEIAEKHGYATSERLSPATMSSSPLITEQIINFDPGVQDDIAIIGLFGTFPGSPSPNIFWKNLIEKKDLITEIPETRWKWQDHVNEKDKKTYVRWGGFIEGIDEFDASFFNISPHVHHDLQRCL